MLHSVCDGETAKVFEQEKHIIRVIIFQRASPLLALCRMNRQRGNPKVNVALVKARSDDDLN